MSFCYICYFKVIVQRRPNGVVGRAAESETSGPGSSLTDADQLFFLFFLKIFRIYGRRIFFWPKKLRIFLKNHYINCRYDRRFTEDLRTPHFWQTNSNYGSWGTNVVRKRGKILFYGVAPRPAFAATRQPVKIFARGSWV